LVFQEVPVDYLESTVIALIIAFAVGGVAQFAVFLFN